MGPKRNGDGTINFEEHLRAKKIRKNPETANVKELSISEAVEMARAIQTRFRDRKELIHACEAWREKEKRDGVADTYGISDEGKTIGETIEAELERNRAVFSNAATGTKSILGILQDEKQNPGHNYHVKLLAAAEELLKRFPDSKPPSDTV